MLISFLKSGRRFGLLSTWGSLLWKVARPPRWLLQPASLFLLLDTRNVERISARSVGYLLRTATAFVGGLVIEIFEIHGWEMMEAIHALLSTYADSTLTLVSDEPCTESA